jgi:hypothetical protein
MQNRKHQSEAALLASERRQREDESPRLRAEVRDLVELSIEISEFHLGGTVPAARHTRRIVVNHAPALFEILCGEERCSGGGFDLTLDVMRALRSRHCRFEGEDVCAGELGSGSCGRVLRYVGHARYVNDVAETGR